MGAMASQINSLTIVDSTVYSGADQRKHQSSASLAFVRGIHRSSVNSPHKCPVTRKMFPFDDVIMIEVHVMHEPVIITSMPFKYVSLISWEPIQQTLMNIWDEYWILPYFILPSMVIPSHRYTINPVITTQCVMMTSSNGTLSASLAFVWAIHRWPETLCKWWLGCSLPLCQLT